MDIVIYLLFKKDGDWGYVALVLYMATLIYLLFQEDEDWGYVAMVLDRFFLWIFATVSLVRTVMILAEAPSLYDESKSIDIKYSRIAQAMFGVDMDPDL